MQDAPLDPFLKFGTGFAGSMWGSRRDPLFIGSLVAGPTTAIGKMALQRVVTSAMIQGGFNAGLSLAEAPAVQAWREKLGMEHGVMPTLEEAGMAALFGMIPGAGIQGLKELAGPVSRLLRGKPEAGDAAKLQEKFPAPPAAADAVRHAEEAVHADAEIIDTVKPPEAPPVADGYTRFYHGGDDPTSGGPRWLTQREDYARNFRAGPEETKFITWISRMIVHCSTNPMTTLGQTK